MSLENIKLILALLLIAGCKQMPQISVPTLPGLGPLKIEIQQGNVITKEMLAKLQPGMTRNQVRFVLGTPLMVDPFRTNRWDYIYSMRKRGEMVEHRQLKVFFEDDKMVRFEGDIVADTLPGAETIAAVKPVTSPAVKPAENPVAKPQPLAPQPEIAKPVVVPAPPAREAAVPVGKPQLQMVPGPGEANPEDIKPVPPVVAAPREAENMVAPPLDSPPMPRLVMPTAQPQFASPIAASPNMPSKPVAAKPEVKPAEKPPAQPGFFGRLFGRSPSPIQSSAAAPAAKPELPAQPAVDPVPAPVVVPAPAPVEKPVVAKPVPKPVETRVIAKPDSNTTGKPDTGRGFFSRLLDAALQPAPPTYSGRDRDIEPGSPPAPFIDPQPALKKP